MRGFGALWRARAEVRDRLGWALAPERGVAGAAQTLSRGLLLEAGRDAYAISADGVWTSMALP